MNILTLVLFLLIAFPITFSGKNPPTTSNFTKANWHIDTYIGTQVSGIRKEDYVMSNFAPYFQVSVGKILTDKFSVNINYQGPYFDYIGDNDKHCYQYIGSDLFINISKLFIKNSCIKWNFLLFSGPGLLFNNYLNNSNLCISGGIINEYRYNKIGIRLKISAIAGYKIYQHDKDILTSVSLGISKYF